MLAYCEICGVLIPGGSGEEAPEGVICGDCFASRQVVVTDATPDPIVDKVQFECVYCRSLLRLPAVQQRTNVKCPQCAEAFFLHPDGNVEARLEANTTAILAKEEALKELSKVERELDGPKTQAVRAHEKTQPISPVSQTQKAALRDLAAKNLDVVQDLPPREVLPVDSRRAERPAGGPDLDLLPDGVGPGEVEETAVQLEPHGHGSDLRASDEGRIDLDVERLRQRTKTRRLRDKAPARRGSKASTRKLARERSPEDARARQEKRERREQRQLDAARKANELERTRAKRSVRGSLLVLSVLLPGLAAFLFLSMTVRGQGFATRGAVGEFLQSAGLQAQAGVRHLDDLLGGALGAGGGEKPKPR
jgi:hypothetical protein